MEAKLGQKNLVADSPQLSLVAFPNWCNGMRVDEDRGESSIVAVSKLATETHRDIFRNCLGAEALFPSNGEEVTVVQHYDSVTFSSKKDDPSEKRFAFHINNKEGRQHSVAYIYSVQDNNMCFDGFATLPGMSDHLERYKDVNQAFCLTANPTVLKEGSKKTAREIFEEVWKNKEGVCAFSILLTRVEEKKKKKMEIVGLSAIADGRISTDTTDSPFLAQRQTHFTNLVAGSETNQKFTTVDLDYKNAPVHIYNVVLFME